ncbi:MAG: hypothetical protein WAV05_09985 [Anaerolineales bacterium]
MNLLFLVAMIVEAIFAFGFIFIPVTLMAQMGLTIDAVGATLTRQFGSALLGFAILLWFSRKSSNLEFKKGVIYALFIYFLVSGLILVIAQFAVQMVPMIWAIVVLHLIFTIWFGYYMVKKD